MQTIDRLIDIFPHSQQQQIRSQLANALEMAQDVDSFRQLAGLT